MPTYAKPTVALAALRAADAKRRKLAAKLSAFLRLNLSKPDRAPAALRSVTLSAANQLGETVPRGAPLRQALTDVERLAVFERAGAAFAADVTGPKRERFFLDGYTVLEGGNAGVRLSAYLLQELMSAMRGGAKWVPVPHNARQQSAFGDVGTLTGLTTSALLPALVSLADGCPAGAGTGAGGVGMRVRDHFRANLARFFLAPAGAGGQHEHVDRNHSASLHLALIATSEAQGTRVWPGSHLTGKKGACSLRIALKPGQYLVALSNLLHSGSSIDGMLGQARIFAYADLLTPTARMHLASTVRSSDPSFSAEHGEYDVAIGGAAKRRKRSTGGKPACDCCA